MFYLDNMIAFVGVLLSVAFFTLMERKVMGLAHYRKGPNKVIIAGISQPIADATKLMSKEMSKMNFIKKTMFMSGPCIGMAIMAVSWGSYESYTTTITCNMKILVVVAIMSLTAYAFMTMSWGSNSKYSLIGGFRAVSQIISYEVCLMLFIMCIIFYCKSFSVWVIKFTQENLWAATAFPPFFICWCLLCMAESNRTPFDMAEGESEIVSGFNIEYGGGLFALIFISEYGMIMLISFLSSMVFMGSNWILLKTFLMCLLFIWVRCAFPRIRYDKLMMTCWKLALPYSLSMITLMCSI